MADLEPIALNLARIVLHLLSDPRGVGKKTVMKELSIADRTYRKYRTLVKKLFADHFRYNGEPQLVVREVDSGIEKRLVLEHTQKSIAEEGDIPGRILKIMLAKQLFMILGDTSIVEVFGEVLDDLMARIGKRFEHYRGLLQPRLDRLIYCHPSAPKDYSGQRDKLDTIVAALIYRNPMDIDYRRGDGKTSEQTIEPLTLMLYKESLYVIGRHEGSTRTYFYAIDRIRSCRRHQTKQFVYPMRHEYDPKQVLDGSFGIIYDDDEGPFEVELDFVGKPYLATLLREREWHPSQAFHDLDDGRLRMTFEVKSMVEVWPWLRSFGSDLEAVTVNGKPYDEWWEVK